MWATKDKATINCYIVNADNWPAEWIKYKNIERTRVSKDCKYLIVSVNSES